jgi:hypothetical protein
MNGMKTYQFVSESLNVTAFTDDSTGTNLPTRYAPWSASDSGVDMPVGGPPDPLPAMVRRYGYFLVSGKGQASGRWLTRP